ncbi:MAG TPA: hypothetical protein VJ717_01485 [Gemmatimonadaceae bacterium]|nr:hypothetical protein [Gemmatimonadaceae bacterium]
MRCTDVMCRSHISLGLVALLAVACTDSPTSVMTPVSDQPLFAVTGKPTLDQTLEGEGWVCKDGTGPATNFTFAVSIDGGAATNHVVALGTCVQVASFPVTPGQQFFHNISVTETVPANWTLNPAILIESNIGNPSVTFQPVVNAPNASARLSHDWGVVFTFTNTHTPPPSFCTRTQGFWKNHTELWNEGATFFNSGASMITILNTPPKGNAYLILAHQYIAAVLNTGGNPSGTASVDAAIAGAAAYFTGAAAGIPDPGEPTRTQLLGWATTLDNFNNGVIGPGHCPD